MIIITILLAIIKYSLFAAGFIVYLLSTTMVVLSVADGMKFMEAHDEVLNCMKEFVEFVTKRKEDKE